MTEMGYIVAIAALLPLMAGLLVCQANPYHALVIRGILGAIAALVYALFGAADVALTEALVGTMLSITLYAVAVRSSMSMRIGILGSDGDFLAVGQSADLLADLRRSLAVYHMRLELVPYTNPKDLRTALVEKDVHAVLRVQPPLPPTSSATTAPYQLEIRVPRLYEIVQVDPDMAEVTLVNRVPELGQPYASKIDGIGVEKA